MKDRGPWGPFASTMRAPTKWFLFLVSILGLTLLIVLSGREEIKFPKGTLVFYCGDREFKMRVEIADTPSLRSVGLMYRKDVPYSYGMFFVFDEDTTSGFWMKNTYIPLEIAFIDRNGVIFEIKKMKPCLQEPCEVYYSSRPYRYALEVKDGFFERHRIGVGCKVKLVRK